MLLYSLRSKRAYLFLRVFFSVCTRAALMQLLHIVADIYIIYISVADPINALGFDSSVFFYSIAINEELFFFYSKYFTLFCIYFVFYSIYFTLSILLYLFYSIYFTLSILLSIYSIYFTFLLFFFTLSYQCTWV